MDLQENVENFGAEEMDYWELDKEDDYEQEKLRQIFSIDMKSLRQKSSQFHGIQDDNYRMFHFIFQLEQDIEQVKRETKEKEMLLPYIDEPWDDNDNNRAVSECRFHSWGLKEASTFFQNHIFPKIEDREKVWQVYRIDFIHPLEPNFSRAWFIGASNYLQDDILRILIKIIQGKAPRRINEGEKPSEFNKYTVLNQYGHSLYRDIQSLDFFQFQILKEETKYLSLLSSSSATNWMEPLQAEFQAITRNNGWINGPELLRGRGGLNFLNPFTNSIQLKWGVSLQHLRSIMDETDFRCKTWTVGQVFERTMKPRTGHLSYVDFLKRTKPELVSEETDWYLPPSCYNCIWYQIVFGGGIPVYAKDPRPIVRGDRFVHVELFLRA
jgi:hypothetical protein